MLARRASQISQLKEPTIDFDAWQVSIDAELGELLGTSNLTRSLLESGLVVWRLDVSGATVTAGPEDHTGLIYLSFSDGDPNMLVKFEPDATRAARYIAERLAGR